MKFIIVAAITGAGVITGLLFAFSNFVMRALAELPAEKGMFAMQKINLMIINPIFLAVFLGTPVLCAIIAGNAAYNFGVHGNTMLLAGAVAYLIGPFGVTVLFNVPLNNHLARADESDALKTWPAYQREWQRWNHLRTYIGIISIVALAAGLGAGGG